MSAAGRLLSGGLLAMALLTCTPGCAFTIVRPPPLVIRSPEAGTTRVVYYPAYVSVHDDQSLWDAHQIKDNIVGLFDGEFLHWIDVGLDAVLPGPDQKPIQHGIESIKNGYAQLPDCAPVRIVGGFFTAFAIEKTTVLGGIRIIEAPGDPMSYFVFTRVIYLIDWVQNTLGEVNTGLGYLVPWEGPFIPTVITTPINDAMDWFETGAVTGYIWVFREINIGLDNVIYGCEWAWGCAVSVFVEDATVPVDQAPSQSAPSSP